MGYVKINLQSGLNLVGSQFVKVGGDTAGMNGLADLAGLGGYDDSEWLPTTELRTWTGMGYVTYGWSGNLRTDSPTMAAEMGVEDDSLDNVWLDEEYGLSEDSLSIGTGFWIKAANAGSVTLVGEVPSDATVTVGISQGLNLLSYPWPKEASFAKISVSGQAGYDDTEWLPTTELRVWTGAGYVTYGWTGSLLTDSPSMAAEMGIDDSSLDNTWLDEDYGVAEDTIPAGVGFWIKAGAAGSVVFSK